MDYLLHAAVGLLALVAFVHALRAIEPDDAESADEPSEVDPRRD